MECNQGFELTLPTDTRASMKPVVADPETKFFVTVVLTMPYSKAEFDKDKRVKFKTAIGIAAGISVSNVDISITNKKRRAGGVDVKTKLRATDASSAEAIASTLGSGDVMLSELKPALHAQGLPAPTSVSVPVMTAGSETELQASTDTSKATAADEAQSVKATNEAGKMFLSMFIFKLPFPSFPPYDGNIRTHTVFHINV